MSHYQTLGVERTASADQIAKAYRKLARQHHPDCGGDAETFARIAAAYETLSDPERRSWYDETGEDREPSTGISDSQMIVAELIAKFAAKPEGELFKQIRQTIEEACRGLKKTLKAGQKKRKTMLKRSEKLNRENSKTKNAAGLKFVLEVMASGIKSLDSQIEDLESDLADMEGALDVVESLKCSGEPVPVGFGFNMHQARPENLEELRRMLYGV